LKWNSQGPPKGDPAPWNLAFCSAFKLDSQNIGVLWDDEGIMRNSIYNVIKKAWKTVRLTTDV